MTLYITACFQTCWMVHRINHIGWSRWSVLWMFVPFVGGIFSLLLLFVPGRKEATDYSELFA
ncbi:DUF805 domain-containing protein [Kiloniella sp.]|uniref:DUF805 domain-containing protein n=1 Tax=Kiloniella sp. TaxID=1938587 RepID=UPI003B01BE77